MKFNKITIGLIVLTVAASVLGTNYVRDINESKEKRRLESTLIPVIEKAAEDTTEPRPSLSFVSSTTQSVTVVLDWMPSPSSEAKNNMREKVLTLVRQELALTPTYWGRHVSVIFADEVVMQGFK